MKATLLIIIALFITEVSMSAISAEQAEKIIEERKGSIERLPLFLEATKQASSIGIVEGLPFREKPKEDREIFEIHGYGFYKRIVNMPPIDKNRIKKIRFFSSFRVIC